MSATLFCLIKGNASTNAFSIKINRDEPISELKKLIKAELHPQFDHVTVKDIKLWKIEIPDDHDSELADPALNDELLATRDVGDYWTAPPKRHIHIIVESPVPTASSSREQELLDRLTSFETTHRVFTIKAFYGKQRKTFSWSVDIGTVTLDSMKLAILKVLPFPQDTKPEDLTLRFGKAVEKNCEELGLEDDATFRQYLKSCALQGFLTLKVQIDTVQKPFSDWKLGKVCELLGLAPGIDEFPTFKCGIDKLDSEKAKELTTHLCKDLRLRYKAIHGETEATRSEYVSPFLVTATSLFDGLVKLYPQLYVEGKYGRGPLDFCLKLLGVIISVVKVKKEDFDQGMAQNVIQLHSSLETNRKRKHDEIESDFADKAYGIVTDGRAWYFVEFIMDGDKPKISVHSGTPAVLDWTEESEALDKGAGRILGRIIWLLKEAKKWGKLDIAEKRRRIN
ncbi:hypothetical protein C2G38_1112978 [Gigaspora rosea]|uniref:Crinkler effector protein N-terminal domain-containing protein n=1 Tax=Gigaspora rosea TaxID=44941 RepID=A0A397VFQ0_9GLOM|nr:hypothetical protein C2G38_1112978 [Gigaspora rosea]